MSSDLSRSCICLIKYGHHSRCHIMGVQCWNVLGYFGVGFFILCCFGKGGGLQQNIQHKSQENNGNKVTWIHSTSFDEVKPFNKEQISPKYLHAWLMCTGKPKPAQNGFSCISHQLIPKSLPLCYPRTWLTSPLHGSPWDGVAQQSSVGPQDLPANKGWVHFCTQEGNR